MALSDLDVKQLFPGDGAETTFAIPFGIIFSDSSEVKVYLDDVLQTEGELQDYTLTGRPDVNSFHVNVEMLVAPADGETLTVVRVLALTQALDLVSAGSVNLSTLETHLDGIIAKIQQLDELMERAPKLKNTTAVADLVLPDPTPGYWPAWNSDGTALENVAGVTITPAEDLAEDFISQAITDGQSAADLTSVDVDGASYTSAIFEYEIIRGTTVMATGRLALHYLNGTWRIEDGGYEGDVHGVTFTQTQTTTVSQLEVALDSGAGSGTIKTSRRRIPA